MQVEHLSPKLFDYKLNVKLVSTRNQPICLAAWESVEMKIQGNRKFVTKGKHYYIVW